MVLQSVRLSAEEATRFLVEGVERELGRSLGMCTVLVMGEYAGRSAFIRGDFAVYIEERAEEAKDNAVAVHKADDQRSR